MDFSTVVARYVASWQHTDEEAKKIIDGAFIS